MSEAEDPDNPRLTVEDIKAIMSYDPESEVDRLDEELQRQIQWKLEACKKAEDLQSKLTETEQVLSWASGSVSLVRPVYNPHGPPESWECESKGFWCVGPTLFDSLYQAWKERKP